jgi:type I restriction enzyme, R subunit
VPLSESDTCRKYITPKIYQAGWTDDQIYQERTFTDGRIILVGDKVKRGKQKRADYILTYKRNTPIAIVEAKAEDKKAHAGLQQVLEYAQMLGVKFAYSTNGHDIIEHDFYSGLESNRADYPSPDELWKRHCLGEGITTFSQAQKDTLLAPFQRIQGKQPRYYQETAINNVIQAIVGGKKKTLLTMATGTGKTFVAFQVMWKLWNNRWNKDSEHRRPRILFLADRAVLIEDPYTKDFAIFGDARHRIKGEPLKSRQIYFTTYQAIAEDKTREGRYKEFSPDFFDLIVIDECHRGSARDDSNWRQILDYFGSAYKLGMTATPRRIENRNTYRYFGNPVFEYSLKQGIDDGFLSPYRVHRIVTSWDAAGWRPMRGQKDRHGNVIPDEIYGTKQFERKIAMKQRTKAVAKHLTEFLKKNDRMAKTIIFCVDQDHAAEMRTQLHNLNLDISREHTNYVVRIVSEEGDTGYQYLNQFMELEEEYPTIVTTSKLLSTGVDVPLCKNIVLFRTINSMVEFKQIIGRGTRIRADYGKYYFNILDYTGSATRLFADPDFDGFPAKLTIEEMDEDGNVTGTLQEEEQPEEEQGPVTEIPPIDLDDEPKERVKLYFDEGSVEIVVDVVYELDSEGKQLRVVKYTDYTAEKVRSMFTSAAQLRSQWQDFEQRAIILQELETRGISLKQLAKVTGMEDADPFDLLCYFAFNSPLKSRSERAERIRKEEKNFFAKFQDDARSILEEVLTKYVEFGVEQFDVDILKVPPISDHGNLFEISEIFGGPEDLRNALVDMQNMVYAV